MNNSEGLLTRIDKRVLLGAIIIIILAILGLLFHISRNPLTTVVEVPSETTQDHDMAKASRYNVVLENSESIVIGTETQIKVDVYDTETQTRITAFDNLELVIVDTELNTPGFFEPKVSDEGYSFNTTFSEAGLFLAYLFFKPVGAEEDVRSFNFYIDNGEFANASQPVDANYTKQIGDIKVTFSNGGELNADKLNDGNQELIFETQGAELNVGKTARIVVINQQTYKLTMFSLSSELSDQNELQFEVVPKQSIFRGVYRIFLSFENEGKSYATEFTSEVK